MGLCEITPLETSTKQIIAYPGNKIGSIHIMVIIDNNYYIVKCFV